MAMASFASALDSRQSEAVLALFAPECFWRDLVAFTWNLRTEEGPEAIATMLAARLADVAPDRFELLGKAGESDGRVEARFGFDTPVYGLAPSFHTA